MKKMLTAILGLFLILSPMPLNAENEALTMGGKICMGVGSALVVTAAGINRNQNNNAIEAILIFPIVISLGIGGGTTATVGLALYVAGKISQ